MGAGCPAHQPDGRPGADRHPEGWARRGTAPLVGDRVEFTPTDPGRGVIESLLPRRNMLTRPRVANIDQVIIIVALASPDPDLTLIDRLLVCCEMERLDALLCFNKVDLVDGMGLADQVQPAGKVDLAAQVQLTGKAELADQVQPAGRAGLDDKADLVERRPAEVLPVELPALYHQAGYRTFCTSALQGTGLDALRQAIRGKVSVLAGPSGVGKSTIINALEPAHALGTSEISHKLGRGRHTTRRVELLPVAGGLVADTPGFSNLELPLLEKSDLGKCFPEFQRFAKQCRFLDCLHRNEPDCAVKEALVKGMINTVRYQHYLSFLAEVSLQERRCY
jgi:ribosome biogenesis GTPase